MDCDTIQEMIDNQRSIERRAIDLDQHIAKARFLPQYKVRDIHQDVINYILESK